MRTGDLPQEHFGGLSRGVNKFSMVAQPVWYEDLGSRKRQQFSQVRLVTELKVKLSSLNRVDMSKALEGTVKNRG